MVNFCAVNGCSSRADRDRANSFYRLPAIITNQGEETRERSRKRREQWIANINRPDLKETSYAYVRVCSDHFISGKSATLYETANPDWAPTLRLGRDRAKDFQAGSVRGKTKRKRKLDSSSDDTLFALSVCNSELQQRCQSLTNVGSESYRKAVHKFLETKEVMDLLMLPDEVFSSQPPCEPIRGEIYLMKIDPSQESSDWTKDGYSWLSLGSNDLILNQSPALRQSTFRMLVNEIETCLLKHVYRSFNNNQKVVIHYVTDERLSNSKSYPHSMDITGTSSVPQTHLGITQYYHQLVEDCNVDSQKSSEALWEMAPTNKEKSPLAHQQRSPLAISDLNQPVEFSSSDQLKVNSNNDIQKAIQPFNMNDVHLSSRSIIDIEQTGRSFGVKPRMKRLPKLKRQFGSGAKDLSVNRSHLSQRPSNQIRSHQRWIKESTGNSSVGEQHFDVVLNKNSVEYNSKVPKINSNSIAHSLSDEVVVLPQSTIPAVQKEKRTLVVPNHQVAVMSNLFSMWKVGRLCDSYISNGTTNVMVHKMVLGAVCPKVLPILYNTSSSLFPKVTFPSSVSKEALLAFAEYMYSGVLDLNEDILVQLKTIGERLDMKDFEQLCSNELNKAKTKDILSAVVEPLLAEPCSLSGLLPSRTHGDSNEVQNSMLMKILGNIYSNNSMQTDVPVTIASTSASSSSSVSDVRSAENMATDQIVDIKTEVESEIEPATNHNSLQLKMEPCSPGENQYSIQEELFMDISNITSNNNLHLTPGTSATSGNIINNQYRNDLNMDSNDIINISDIPQSEETCLSQHTEDCDKDTDNQKELQLISVTSATGNISEDSLIKFQLHYQIAEHICWICSRFNRVTKTSKRYIEVFEDNNPVYVMNRVI
ncbi:XP_029633843.1uncharacterized protein LOC115209549 isoform X1 [Octopus vulgaris]|uniref:XP_029633843.1uncharacterized protein LOC115209549 isoform X1 n=1 Tax=Octopus vulgaris TaxID=6645 RepID=A0AA36APZ6_OCTVU|nr:XP_029633843.1uncharacterized protein LOC115209549 isoform X1 [Octopus vulgaris]